MPKVDLMPTADVARVLKVHVRTVHRLVERGEIAPAVRIPGTRGALLFDRRDVERLARSRAA